MDAPKKSKVLIVDDEPHILTALEFLLEKQGYIVKKAFNGKEALEILSDFDPNIIVLDVMMPELNGFEVAQAIRNDIKNQDLHIIFLTAKGTPNDKINGYSRGAEVYITKPFDNDEFLEAVASVNSFDI